MRAGTIPFGQPTRNRRLSGVPAHLEAAGAVTGRVDDPTIGLPSQLDTAGRRWVQSGGVWLLTHKIVLGDTLADESRGQRSLDRLYYGAISLELTRRIGNHPLNVRVLGPQFVSAYPGDVIVIPGLTPNFTTAQIPTNNDPPPTPPPDDRIIPANNPPPEAPGVSTGVKIAVGVVALAAVAAAAWLAWKSSKKKRNPFRSTRKKRRNR